MARTFLFARLSRILRTVMREQGATSLPRREVIRLGAGTLVGATFLQACGSGGDSDGAELRDEDVVVVGGGTAGLTAAYRLAQAGVRPVVYEGSPRFGGRMYTEANFNADGMFVERGGELVDTGHPELIALAKELGLEIEGFASGETDLPLDTYFDGTAVRSEEEVVTAFTPLAAVIAADVAALSVDGEYIAPTFDSVLVENDRAQELDKMSLAAYLDAQTGVDQWLRDLLRFAYVGEYGLEAEQQSALNLIILIGTEVEEGFAPFGASDEALRIKGGSESLPRALVAALDGKATLNLEHRLASVSDNGSKIVLIFERPGSSVEVRANKVVFALPCTTLREVAGIDALGLSAPKLAMIQTLGYGTNAKLMLGFSSKFWRSGSAYKCNGSILTTNSGFQFWETSRLQTGASGILTHYLGGEAGRIVGSNRVAESLAELGKIFPGIDATYDGTKLLQHWPSEPFAKGSYSCPLPGQYLTLWGAGVPAELDGRAVFCGEHTSVDYGGYMNGAVESGARAAAQLVGSVGLKGTRGLKSRRRLFVGRRGGTIR